MGEPSKPPAPGECHPFYARHSEELQRWLNNTRDERRAVLHSPRLVAWLDDQDTTLEYSQLILSRREAYGPAPYVGWPFHYRWRVGVDSEGRGVGGQAHMVHETGGPRWLEYMNAAAN